MPFALRRNDEDESANAGSLSVTVLDATGANDTIDDDADTIPPLMYYMLYSFG